MTATTQLDPVTAAWQFVADNMDSIEKYASRWRGSVDLDEFTQRVTIDVFDAHARGLYRPGASAPGTWIYTRARLINTEAGRVEYRRRGEVSSETGPPLRQDHETGAWYAAPGKRVGIVVPVPAGGWGSHEAAESRALLSQVIQAGDEGQRQACFTVLADLGPSDLRASGELCPKARTANLKRLSRTLEN